MIVPDSEFRNGYVNFLIKNTLGEWWVTTYKDGSAISGMPLDYFLEYGGDRQDE